MREDLKGAELAAVLRVSPKTVGRWAREGVIPSLRLGPKVTRYSLPDVLAALKARRMDRSDGEPATAAEATDATA